MLFLNEILSCGKYEVRKKTQLLCVYLTRRLGENENIC